ncbi:MAG: hypothetical protein WBG38_07085 [Nodosilinea sp.]
MTISDLSFAAKLIVLSGALSAAVKYVLPTLLAGSLAGQNPSLAAVAALLLAPSALMGGLFWLRRNL